MSDSNLEFAAHVFGLVTSNSNIADMLSAKASGMKRGEVFTFTAEMLEVQAKAFRANSKMISQLFEENQHVTDLIEKAMAKNHPQGIFPVTP